jgi:heptosyltransferase-2
MTKAFNNPLGDIKKKERIVIRGVNWIGDAVMTTPAIKAIRQHFIDAHISLIVRPHIVPLFEKDHYVDEIISYTRDYNGMRGKFRFAQYLKSQKFDRAIILQNALDGALIMWLARIPERAGYRTDGRHIFLTRAVKGKRKNPDQHHVYYYLTLLNKIYGITLDRPELELFLSNDERLRARALISDTFYDVPVIIGINPGATYGSAKRWMPQRFASVADRAAQNFGAGVIVFGSSKEKPLADEIVSKMKTKALNLAGKTDLSLLASLIAECDALITNDSGPMHMAAALNVPVVAIFGSTNPVATGPFGSGHRVLRADMSCSPCLKRTCPQGHLTCMESITVDHVYDELAYILSGHKTVFLDRDGTLIKDAHYLNNFNDISILPHVKKALLMLKEKGFKLIGVTNQSGIARGIVKEDFVTECHRYLIEELQIDDFYYCPHHPDERCQCRKPSDRLFKKARLEHNINLKKSYIIGDKNSDVLSAGLLSAKGILVRTGKEQESHDADYSADNLLEAAQWILEDVS